MKININKIVGIAQMGSQPRLEFFQNIEKQLTQGHKFEVHPEADFLKKYVWRGMVTIRFESGAYSEENNSGDSRRAHFIRRFMNDLRRKWKLRSNQFYWVGSTEFGESGFAHIHIVFTFHPIEATGIKVPDLKDFEHEAKESILFLCGELDIKNSAVNLHWIPKFDDYGLINYVCKKEVGRDFKHFQWSSGGHTWKTDLTNYIVTTVSKEVAQ